MRKSIGRKQSLTQSYIHLMENKEQANPKNLNLGLLSNPFLKDKQQFRAIHKELNHYNKRITDGIVTDQYQVMSYEKLFTLTGDLMNMNCSQDMVRQLEVTWQWWGQQKRKIKQRKDLGMVKYKTDRQVEKIRELKAKIDQVNVVEQEPTLPNEIQYQERIPFENKHRTVHPEISIPLRRLAQYKTKKLNIIDTKLYESVSLPQRLQKVLYPKPPKYVPPEEIQPENQENTVQEGIEPQNTNPEQTQNANTAPIEGQPPQEDDPNKPPQAEETNQQDLGLGFGQQPGQEDEAAEQQIPAEDRLAPKNKIYTWSQKQRQEYNKQKKFSRPYMFYKGWENEAQRRMEQKALISQQYSLQLKRQEEQLIQKAHQWATQKQKISKQRQFLLQHRLSRPNYSLAVEDPEKQQMLSAADEKKYGFYIPQKPKVKNQISFEDKLPQISKEKPYESEIRSDRLNSLKKKFSNMLNLRESSQDRSNASSLCQVSPRRRNFSMILEEHSLEKQKYRQLQEIQKIKQSLGRHRINVNIGTLSHALVPQTYDYKQQEFQSPTKALLNNPFFVAPAKKKKKKK